MKGPEKVTKVIKAKGYLQEKYILVVTTPRRLTLSESAQ